MSDQETTPIIKETTTTSTPPQTTNNNTSPQTTTLSPSPQTTTTTTTTTFPQPPVLHDHLRPSDSSNNSLTTPSTIFNIIPDTPDPVPLPLPQRHENFPSQPSPPQTQSQQHYNQRFTSQSSQPHPIPSHQQPQYNTMPINDRNKSTIAFDMYIPTQNNYQYQQPHTNQQNDMPLGCDCCPHHHKRKDGSKVLYRHLKQPTWWQYIKDKCFLAWEFTKHTFWHVEPWVFRPLLAGITYNIGIQLARVAIQHFFPTFFPTTVYLPLRSNAKFYDLHAKKVILSAAAANSNNNNNRNTHNNTAGMDTTISPPIPMDNNVEQGRI